MIPTWLINTFSIIGFMTVWCVVVGYIASRLFSLTKDEDYE